MNTTTDTWRRKGLQIITLLLVAGWLGGCSLIVSEERPEGYCGDGHKSNQEQCDGSDFGGQTCKDFHGTNSIGDLLCNEHCAIETHECQSGSVCPNGICEPDENDQNCNQDCWQDNCWDGECQEWENSETCPHDCVPAVCGNGTQEGAEDCDGQAFAGHTCQSLGFESGTLYCYDNCRFSLEDCTPNGEAPDGDVCGGPADCQGNACIVGTYNGVDLSYCSHECELGVCPGGGVCIRNGPAAAPPLCYEVCDNPSTCQAGFHCFEVVPEMPTVCWPPLP